MKQRKKQAFALTELLVVVVVVGVLAAVVLPKFNKIMETRKTMEAEEVMAAVRMEQEKRCALDKPYIGNIAKLSEIIPQETTANFHYELESTGMLASSKGNYSYNLKMPSYADGRLCCDGDECDKLNKNYPSCEELTAKEDYQVAMECATEDGECANGAEQTALCNGCGTRVTSRCENGHWTVVNGECSKTEEECGDKPCKQEYCGSYYDWQSPNHPWKEHPSWWYDDRTWKTVKTECCDPREKCPDSCDVPGQKKIADYKRHDSSRCCATPCKDTTPDDPERTIRNPSVTYAEDGSCWMGSCQDVCGGQDCPKMNEQFTQELQASGQNRKTVYMSRSNWINAKSECYQCNLGAGYSDTYRAYIDKKQNVINRGFDKNDCSVPIGCPKGYVATDQQHVCAKPLRFVPREHKQKGILIAKGGSQTWEGQAAVLWFDDGSYTFKNGCPRWQGAEKRYGIAGASTGSVKCSDYGGATAYCNAQCPQGGYEETCDASPCLADDAVHDYSSIQDKLDKANKETTWTVSGTEYDAGPGTTIIDNKCCQDNEDGFSVSLGGFVNPVAGESGSVCRRANTIATFDTHYYTCERVEIE